MCQAGLSSNFGRYWIDHWGDTCWGTLIAWCINGRVTKGYRAL